MDPGRHKPSRRAQREALESPVAGAPGTTPADGNRSLNDSARSVDAGVGDEFRYEERILDQSPGLRSTVPESGIVKIVITDDQLAHPLEMFASEAGQSASAQPPTALDITEYQPRPTPTPPAAAATRLRSRHSMAGLAAIVGVVAAVAAVILLSGSAMMKRADAPPASNEIRVRSAAGAAAAENQSVAANPSPPQLASPANQPAPVVNGSNVTPARDAIPSSPVQTNPPRSATASRNADAAQQSRALPRSAATSANAFVGPARPASSPASTPPLTPPVAVAPPSAPPPTRIDAGSETPVREAEARPAPAALSPTPSPNANPPAPALAPKSSPPANTLSSTASAAAPSAAPALTAETGAVAAVLNRYQQAFSALDVNAAHAVWPSVDQKALAKAFAQLDEQTFALEGCNIIVAGARAEADCAGNARYIRKVGSRALRVEPRQWHFRLRQIDDQWVIDTVGAR